MESDLIPELPLSELLYVVAGVLVVLGAIIVIKGLIDRRKKRDIINAQIDL